MKSRKLTVGSLKTRTLTIHDNLLSKDTGRIERKIKPQKQETKKIDVMQNNKLFSIVPNRKNISLLDLALVQNQLLSFKCKKGTCGKCAVKLLSGASYLEGETIKERVKLKDEIEHGYRLSCQAVVTCT